MAMLSIDLKQFDSTQPLRFKLARNNLTKFIKFMPSLLIQSRFFFI